MAVTGFFTSLIHKTLLKFLCKKNSHRIAPMGSPYDNIVSKNGGNVKRKDNVLFLHKKPQEP